MSRLLGPLEFSSLRNENTITAGCYETLMQLTSFSVFKEYYIDASEILLLTRFMNNYRITLIKRICGKDVTDVRPEVRPSERK